MIDNPEKTARLLAALKAAVPFEVELTERLAKHLCAQNVAGADKMHHTVSDLSYAGHEGGIVCHLVSPEEGGSVLVVSLTHLMARRQGPLFESLTYDKAPEADRVIRPQAADSHQGPERDRSSNRPDTFVHPSRRPQKSRLAAGGVHRLS